jgi:carbon-monoxide dehydrogenase medium subunit
MAGMKAPEFDYVRAGSVEEAVAALGSRDEAKLLAGGQSLVPLLNMRLVRPQLLVDVTRIDGLAGIEHENGTLRIGATTTQRDAELSPAVTQTCPLLAQALSLVAHPQIRNRGTIGGSLAHADPAAELPAVVVALDGVMHATGPAGSRAIPAADFFRSYLTTALAPDEVLTHVELPVPAPGAGWDCAEVARRPGDFPLCGVACLVELADGAIADVRIALYGVAERPVRAYEAEQHLQGERPEPSRLGAAGDAAAELVTRSGDLHASPEYRRHLTAVIVRRAVAAAVERGRAHGGQ